MTNQLPPELLAGPRSLRLAVRQRLAHGGTGLSSAGSAQHVDMQVERGRHVHIRRGDTVLSEACLFLVALAKVVRQLGGRAHRGRVLVWVWVVLELKVNGAGGGQGSVEEKLGRLAVAEDGWHWCLGHK